MAALLVRFLPSPLNSRSNRNGYRSFHYLVRDYRFRHVDVYRALFGAFPLAYAVIIDALTIPLTIMLIGLIFRGVAFEFRFKATPAHRPFWDKAFIGGSIVAAFSQGITVGAVIHGFSVTGRAYSGGPFDWFTAFNLFCGAGLVVAYALLGSTWLVMKSENALQQRMRQVSKVLLLLLQVFIAVISIWTPLAQPAIAARWFTLPNLFYLLPVPALVAILSLCQWRCLNAAPAQSQGFMLVGALLIIPVILVYTFWSYYVFRGKVQHGEGYH